MSVRRAVIIVATGVFLAGHASPLVAQKAARQSNQHGADIAIGFRTATLGVGVQVSKLLVSHVGVRVAGDFFDLKIHNQGQNDIKFDMEAKVRSFSALLDLYPGARGAFHLTGGLMTNPLKITATGRATGGSYEINHHTYASSQVGKLTGTGEFGSALPYVGLGFGTAASKHRGLSAGFDLGIAIGKPKISLTAEGTSSNAQLQSDLDEQIATTQKDANKVPGFPVIAFTLMYRF